jgi:hypothetical protein
MSPGVTSCWNTHFSSTYIIVLKFPAIKPDAAAGAHPPIPLRRVGPSVAVWDGARPAPVKGAASGRWAVAYGEAVTVVAVVGPWCEFVT